MDEELFTFARYMEAATRGNLKEFDGLVSTGFLLNVRNINNKTLLHILCSQGLYLPDALPFIKCLISKGADLNVLDGDNLTPIQLAADYYNSPIVEYLAHLAPVLIQYKASAFEILGAQIGTEEATLMYWDKALSLKSQVSNEGDDMIYSKMDSFKVFRVKEIRDCQELTSVVGDRMKRDQYCFLYLCKNLGLEHNNTLRKLYQLSQVYQKSGVAHHSYEAEFIKRGIFQILESEETVFLVSANISGILSHWIKIFRSKNNIHYQDIGKIFQLLVEQLERFGKVLKDGRSKKDATPDVRFVQSVMSLCFEVEKSIEDKRHFNRIVKYLIKVDQEFYSYFGTSILHETVAKTNPSFFFLLDETCVYGVTELLLNSGISVNLLNKNKETALHRLLMHKQLSYRKDHLKTYIDVVNLLLENDTDIDIHDVKGFTTINLLHELGIYVCEAKHRTLQCLAASSIKQHKINFSEKVPKQIQDFIDLH